MRKPDRRPVSHAVLIPLRFDALVAARSAMGTAIPRPRGGRHPAGRFGKVGRTWQGAGRSPLGPHRSRPCLCSSSACSWSRTSLVLSAVGGLSLAFIAPPAGVVGAALSWGAVAALLRLLPTRIRAAASAAAGRERGYTSHPAPVAQGIERAPPEREVAGSNPAGRTDPGIRCTWRFAASTHLDSGLTRHVTDRGMLAYHMIMWHTESSHGRSTVDRGYRRATGKARRARAVEAATRHRGGRCPDCERPAGSTRTRAARCHSRANPSASGRRSQPT